MVALQIFVPPDAGAPFKAARWIKNPAVVGAVPTIAPLAAPLARPVPLA
jgi:hypothetical protein